MTTSTDTVVKTLYRCSVCGQETDWDPELGPEPLCQVCWDRWVAGDFAAKHAYYLNNKDRIAATNRVYRAAHKEQIAASNLAWREAHRNEVCVARRAWWKERRAMIAGGQQCTKSLNV